MRRGDLHRGGIRRGGGRHEAAARRPDRRTARDAARADDRGGAPTSASRRPRSCATRCARCRRCASASRRWRPPRWRPRRVRPEGRPQRVPSCRSSRCAAAASANASSWCRPRRCPAAIARCWRPRSSSSTSGASRRRRSICRSSRSRNGEAMEAWLSERGPPRAGSSVPQRGDKRALVELAHRQRRARVRTPLQRDHRGPLRRARDAARRARLPTLPRRIECFDISTIQGSETVASMVVCEDGRMRQRVSEVRTRRPVTPEGSRRFRGHARGRAAALRAVLEPADRSRT